MKFNFSALRGDAENIEDPVKREKTLRDLSRLENLEFDTQHSLAEINRERQEKLRILLIRPRIRRLKFALIGLLAGIVLLAVLFGALQSS